MLHGHRRRANTVVVSSQGSDLATSVPDTASGGAININDETNSSANVTSTVTAQIGQSGSVVIATALVDVVAAGITDADATTRSGSGGAINVNDFEATVNSTPNINVSVGAGASITASTVTIRATHNTTPPTYSNGVFTGVDASDGITGNTITFSAEHGLNTGQFVTYQHTGSPGTFGLESGRRYGVIIPVGTGIESDKSLQLGTAFAGPQSTRRATHNVRGSTPPGRDQVGTSRNGRGHRV